MILDRGIFKAIKGHSETHPQDLVGILAYVDSHEKLVLTHEELAACLSSTSCCTMRFSPNR